MLPNQQSSPIMPPPAQLWIGQHEQLVPRMQEYLKQQLCQNKGCSICSNCRQIAAQQHHAVLWLLPEKQYTLEQLEPIFNTISFSLASDENYFFVIQRADLLTPACANSLLKSIEEPPAGYHFILLAERQDLIMPTIRSRCLIELLNQTSVHTQPVLLNHFKNSSSDVLQFMKDLDLAAPSEHESMHLVDRLLNHWITLYKTALAEDNASQQKQAQGAIALLQETSMLPPMPGSSKVFWKNLFLRFQQMQRLP